MCEPGNTMIDRWIAHVSHHRCMTLFRINLPKWYRKHTEWLLPGWYILGHLSTQDFILFYTNVEHANKRQYSVCNKENCPSSISYYSDIRQETDTISLCLLRFHLTLSQFFVKQLSFDFCKLIWCSGDTGAPVGQCTGST